MSGTRVLGLMACWLSFLWALTFTPLTYINLQRYLYRNDYRRVLFEVERLHGVSGSPYALSAIGQAEGREESMGLGHFYLGSEILPADAERRFAPGTRVPVYYNPGLSNFTMNSRTARFVSPERFAKLTAPVTLRMLLRIYGPLLLALLLWNWFGRRPAGS